MGSSRQIAKGVAWTIIYNVVNGVYGFVSVPILIAYFGKSDYGLIGLAVSVNVYLRLMDLGFNSTNVRFFSSWIVKKEYNKINRLFQTSLSFYGLIGFLNALVLIITSILSDSIFNVNSSQAAIVKHLFYILAISAFISWFTSCFEQLIVANEEVGWAKKISLLPKLLQIVVLLLTVFLHFSIESYYALTAFSLFVVIPFMVNKIKSLCPFISFKPHFYIDSFKEVIFYSLNIFSFGIFQFSVSYLRPLFLGMESNLESITEYNVLNGIIGIVLLLGGAFMGVVLPSASKVVAQGNIEAQYKIAYRGTKYITITLCLCCFGMMAVVPEMLTAYVGIDYLHLTFWLDLWLISTLAAHNQAISSLILAGTDIKAITLCTIVSSTLSLLLCWYLIPIYDVGGTVIAYLVYCLLQILFYYVYYWPKVMRINSRKIFLNSFLPYVIVGTIIALTLRNIPFVMSVWPSLIIKGFLFFLIYLFLTIAIIDKEDKNYFYNLIKKK